MAHNGSQLMLASRATLSSDLSLLVIVNPSKDVWEQVFRFEDA
jgi:hypothetical protein